MFLTEYKKGNGQTIALPEGFRLTINETSNSVYQLDLFDEQMRSVSDHGTDLDDMVEKAIEALIKMRS
ncbi:MAG TPA: hypothetical protein VK589_30760 [Chryseolinea sp.]|nr:hypothetical protein [Chryseolinea sp.]